jgi:hypothetical protein
MAGKIESLRFPRLLDNFHNIGFEPFNFPQSECDDGSSIYLGKRTGRRLKEIDIIAYINFRSRQQDDLVRASAGVYANLGWFESEELYKIIATQNVLPKSQMLRSGYWPLENFKKNRSRFVEALSQLEKQRYFSNLADVMIAEYVAGRAFINTELIPASLQRFPDFSVLVNMYDTWKQTYFIDPNKGQAITWRLDRAFDPAKYEFTNRVGRVIPVTGEDEGDNTIFEMGDNRFWMTDFRAVWYPTENSDTTYDPQDTNRRTELLGQSLTALEDYLYKNNNPISMSK